MVQNVPCVSVQSSGCEDKSLEASVDLSGKILTAMQLVHGDFAGFDN